MFSDLRVIAILVRPPTFTFCVTYPIYEIESCAFYYCTSLSSITLSNKITTLPNQIFEHTAISSFVIEKNITKIDTNVFSDCSNLNSVIFEDPNNWTYNGESINVDDIELNAYLLTKVYNGHAWEKIKEA